MQGLFLFRSGFFYRGCQKNVPEFERFFLQPHTRLCRVSLIRNKIMKSGIKPQIRPKGKASHGFKAERINRGWKPFPHFSF